MHSPRPAQCHPRYGLLIGFVVLLTAGILANMPGLASPSLVLCLVFLVVAWALVGASTSALKVGNDGCVADGADQGCDVEGQKLQQEQWRHAGRQQRLA